ncbi:MAG: hypothetical protein P4L27_12460 [Ignavibacteriaceae bacterium]|nr:hypothetical protein [Ignavibacteriaceae bacterium]
MLLLFLPLSIYPESSDVLNKGNILSNYGNLSDPVEPVIIWNFSAAGIDSIDQLSFLNAFSSIGFLPEQLSLHDLAAAVLNKNMLIILPNASALFLSELDVRNIILAVNNGARLFTDGNNKFTQSLNIKFSPPTQVKFIRDRSLPHVMLHWADAPSVPMIINAQDKTTRVIYSDSITGQAIGVLKTYGRGSCLVLSALFDPFSGNGYSRFPNLTNFVITEMYCRPLFQRRGVDAYFDPGYRYDIPIKKLVSIWHNWGIRAVHASAWNLYDSPSYDYNLLITEAHKQGILVYAWLEWPYVGEKFWNEHPEWREKNALLKDAKIDFLFLMDLQNPSCMKSALKDLTSLLKDDWDGIDIAEFSITGGVSNALEGPNEPKDFTGFNLETREEFKLLYGFDQVELFNKSSLHYWKKDSAGLDKFYKYRVNVNNRLLRQIVSSMDSVRTKDNRDWEFVFTVLDNSLHPEFDQLLGFDLPNTLNLAREFHAVLQVEDPASEWIRPPSRYKQLANSYSGIVGNTPFAIDINVVPLHPLGQKGFAFAQPTGAELFQQFNVADLACSRVCFYSESTIYPYDWDILPYVMASRASITFDNRQWHINTPHTVILKNAIIQEEILLDGKPWPCYGPNGIIIPIGYHALSVKKPVGKLGNIDQYLRLTGISDELISCNQSGNGIVLAYQSPARCFITLNRLPANIKVDGKPEVLKTIKANGNFIIFAPSGKHKLDLK